MSQSFFFFFREFQLMASTLDIQPNVEFRIELLKTNSSLAKSTLQQKTCGYTQKKTASNRFYLRRGKKINK